MPSCSSGSNSSSSDDNNTSSNNTGAVSLKRKAFADDEKATAAKRATASSMSDAWDQSNPESGGCWNLQKKYPVATGGHLKGPSSTSPQKLLITLIILQPEEPCTHVLDAKKIVTKQRNNTIREGFDFFDATCSPWSFVPQDLFSKCQSCEFMVAVNNNQKTGALKLVDDDKLSISEYPHGIVTSTVLVISKIVLVTLFLFLDRTTYR